MTSGIYKITNKVNGHRYIGNSSNINTRWVKHISKLKFNKHHSRYLQHAWNKYGADAFEFTIIEQCETKRLIEREQFFLDTMKPEYNISPNASSRLGIKATPETIAKITSIVRNRSAETRAKMSASHKSLMTPEFRAKMSAVRKGKPNGLLGYKHTPESRVKMSEKARGNKNSVGKVASPETRAKQRAAKLGKKQSEESRMNKSLSITAWWAKKKAKQ